MRKALWTLIIVVVIGGAALALMFLPPPVNVIALTGELEPQVETFATDDTTDIDGAGTWRVFKEDGNPMEAERTWGTHAMSADQYTSGATFYFVCKSTTANAMDHYSWKVTLPFGPNARVVKPTYEVTWDEANTRWDLTFKGAQEAQPKLLCRNTDGTDVGTTAQDLSDNDYVLVLELVVSIQTNYDAIFTFFDPEEGKNGEWDKLFIIMTANVSAANCGWSIDSPWTECNDGKSYYLDLTPYIVNGMLVRWDEEEMDGVIILPFVVRSTDLDVSGSGDVLFTFNMKECQDTEQAFYQTWESDTDTNFHTAVTAETVECTD